MGGIELTEQFSGYKVFYIEENNNVYIKCKGVYLDYNKYLRWKKDPINEDDILGYNKQNVGCKIREYNNTVEIGCLKDTSTQFSKILKLIHKISKSNGSKKKSTSSKS